MSDKYRKRLIDEDKNTKRIKRIAAILPKMYDTNARLKISFCSFDRFF